MPLRLALSERRLVGEEGLVFWEEKLEVLAMAGALLYVLRTCRPSGGWRAGREMLSSAGMLVRE